MKARLVVASERAAMVFACSCLSRAVCQRPLSTFIHSVMYPVMGFSFVHLKILYVCRGVSTYLAM